MRNPKNTNLTKNSQELRREMTPEERHLWYDFLKTQPFTVKRQAVIDRYIVDFYVPSYKLIIELDGDQHYHSKHIRKDKDRDDYFNKIGLTVVRYSNVEINNDFYSVCENILNIIKSK